METITIVALLPPSNETDRRTLSNEEYLRGSKIDGRICTLGEFEKLWNSDEILVKHWFIRFLEVSKDSFRLV